MLIYYLKIVRHTTVSDSTRLKSYSEKRWLSTLFRSRGNRRKSQGQNGAHKRTAARMSCRLTLFRMALFSFPYITCSVGPVAPVVPVTPVGPVAPVAPVAPLGPVGPVGHTQPEPPFRTSTASDTRTAYSSEQMHGQQPHTQHLL